MAGKSSNLALMLFGAAAVVLSWPIGANAQGQGAGQNPGQNPGQPNAQPRCGLVVEYGPDQWIINYNPLTDDGATRQFDLAIVNRGDGPCTGVVSVDLRGEPFGLSQAGDTTRLPYVLVEEGGSTDLTPRAGESQRPVETRPINLGPNERVPLRFSLSASTADMLAAGLYSQTAFIRVSHPNGAVWTEWPVTLGVRVASAAMMGLKGDFTRVGGVATINLGPLTEGARALNTNLYVLSTSGYAVSVTSENGGRLLHEDRAWHVDYSLAIGSRLIDLTGPSRMDVVSSRPRFDDYPLAINIGSVTGRRAGAYTDVITFTIAAI